MELYSHSLRPYNHEELPSRVEVERRRLKTTHQNRRGWRQSNCHHGNVRQLQGYSSVAPSIVRARIIGTQLVHFCTSKRCANPRLNLTGSIFGFERTAGFLLISPGNGSSTGMVRKNLEYCVRVWVNGHLDDFHTLEPSPIARVQTLGDFFSELGQQAELTLEHILR